MKFATILIFNLWTYGCGGDALYLISLKVKNVICLQVKVKFSQCERSSKHLTSLHGCGGYNQTTWGDTLEDQARLYWVARHQIANLPQTGWLERRKDEVIKLIFVFMLFYRENFC